MITKVLCDTPGWATRTTSEIRRRLGLITKENNLLHGFNPVDRPEKTPVLFLAHKAVEVEPVYEYPELLRKRAE